MYKLIENDTSNIASFSGINKSSINSDFETRICTYAYLDFVCDGAFVNSHGSVSKASYYTNSISSHGQREFLQKVNGYIGHGDFNYEFANKKWNGGVVSEMRNFEKDQYLLVIVTKELVEPEFVASPNSFFKGKFKGKLYAVNINTCEIVAVQNIYAENDDSIKSIALKDYAMNDKLMKNLGVNILKVIAAASFQITGKSLQDLDSKMAGLNP